MKKSEGALSICPLRVTKLFFSLLQLAGKRVKIRRVEIEFFMGLFFKYGNKNILIIYVIFTVSNEVFLLSKTILCLCEKLF